MIRICTWNLWHGLNPYSPPPLPPVMLPLENPWARLRRRSMQIDALRELRGKSNPKTLDLFCMQEVSPFPKRLALLKRKLGLEGEGCLVNSGIKLGPVGFPPLLMEGIAILHSAALTQPKGVEHLLSGGGLEWHGPFGSLISFQTGRDGRLSRSKESFREKRF